MNISSIRLGFANNSSSTHSILIGCKHPTVGDPADFHDEFHATTPESKALYVAVTLYGEMYNIEDAIRQQVVEEILGTRLPDLSKIPNNSLNPLLYCPRGYDRKTRSKAYGKYLYDQVINNPDVTIAGGSDNAGMPSWARIQQPTDDDEEAWGRFPEKELIYEPICIERDDILVLFNPMTGAKVRIAPDSYTRASKPELVDLKITDYCPHGCPFCYQDSTRRGAHAPLGLIKDILRECARNEVLEVAIGGGEPTLHPDFAEILRYAHSLHIVPNFTTFNMGFAVSLKLAKAVKAYAGSFAMSSLAQADLEKLMRWNNRHKPGHIRPFSRRFLTERIQGTLQIPMGCYPRERVEAAITYAMENKLPVTLLGFKDFGRGVQFKASDYPWVIEAICRGTDSDIRFGADTLFVTQFKNQLDVLGIAPSLRVGQEGQFSCYIDAVAKTMGACSYTDKMHPLPTRMDQLFSKFPYPAEDARNRFVARPDAAAQQPEQLSTSLQLV